MLTFTLKGSEVSNIDPLTIGDGLRWCTCMFLDFLFSLPIGGRKFRHPYMGCSCIVIDNNSICPLVGRDVVTYYLWSRKICNTNGKLLEKFKIKYKKYIANRPVEPIIESSDHFRELNRVHRKDWLNYFFLKWPIRNRKGLSVNCRHYSASTY